MRLVPRTKRLKEWSVIALCNHSDELKVYLKLSLTMENGGRNSGSACFFSLKILTSYIWTTD